jgi:hypothetical protein
LKFISNSSTFSLVLGKNDLPLQPDKLILNKSKDAIIQSKVFDGIAMGSTSPHSFHSSSEDM